jgi:iron complex transport system substrate-binding protein
MSEARDPYRAGRTDRETRRVRAAAALIALALAASALGGCISADRPGAGPTPGSTATAPAVDLSIFPLTVTDDAFRQVTLAGPATRIVSLAPANTEIVYSLRMFEKIVGVTTYDDYPPYVANVPKVGDFTTPNLEAIAAARPDVILVTGGVQADVLGKLEGLGAKVVVIDPKDIKGVYAGVRLVARILGVPAEGEAVVADMESKLAHIRAAVSAEVPVRAFLEIGWNPLFTAGPGTLLDDVLTQAGGVNVVTEKGYVGYSVEQLVKDQPAVYLGTYSSIGDGTALIQRPGYSAVVAVKDGRVFALTDDLVSRPGPRIIDGVLEIARVLHPDLFE